MAFSFLQNSPTIILAVPLFIARSKANHVTVRLLTEGTMTPTEEFGQLRLKFTDPVQHHYEVIRPIVLFSETISERSRQTGIERTQVGQKARRRFVRQGMFGLTDFGHFNE